MAKQAQDAVGSIRHGVNGVLHDGVTLLADDDGVYLICSRDGMVWQISAKVPNLRVAQQAQTARARGGYGKRSRGTTGGGVGKPGSKRSLTTSQVKKLQAAHPELFGVSPPKRLRKPASDKEVVQQRPQAATKESGGTSRRSSNLSGKPAATSHASPDAAKSANRSGKDTRKSR